MRRFWILSVALSLFAANVAATAHICNFLADPGETSLASAASSDDGAGNPTRGNVVDHCDLCAFAATAVIVPRTPEASAFYRPISLTVVPVSAICSDPLLPPLLEPPR